MHFEVWVHGTCDVRSKAEMLESRDADRLSLLQEAKALETMTAEEYAEWLESNEYASVKRIS